MKPVVDHDLCIGCELCADTCPRVFEMRADGYSWVIAEETPPDQQDCAREAADLCPVQAISIEE
jgi:ferredoxin